MTILEKLKVEMMNGDNLLFGIERSEINKLGLHSKYIPQLAKAIKSYESNDWWAFQIDDSLHFVFELDMFTRLEVYDMCHVYEKFGRHSMIRMRFL